MENGNISPNHESITFQTKKYLVEKFIKITIQKQWAF